MIFKNNIVVSICCVTYNHENYLRQCLDGFVMQKTSFPFEILVHEDASTDSTAKILKEYEAKYPHLFRCVYQSENQFAKQNTLINILFPMSRGKYVALCEGDDYWTDPYKLQKQVNFLEANTDYGLVSSDITLINEEGEIIPDTEFLKRQKKYAKSGNVFFDLIQYNFINTLTVCFRRSLIDFDQLDSDKHWYFYDYGYWLKIAMKAKVHIMNEKTAYYRIHDKNISRQKDYLAKRSPWIKYDTLKEFLTVFPTNLAKKEKEIISNELYSLFRSKYLPISAKFWAFKQLTKNADATRQILANKLKKKIVAK